jgi:hypothetical protein
MGRSGVRKRGKKPALKGPSLRPVTDSAYEGHPAEFPTTKLPLYKDVGLAMEIRVFQKFHF